jgi:RNA polymerase sigma factor (sigma-70 family)
VRLRAGDERAFEALVDRHYRMMLTVARGYVRTRAVAEEVVQEAWLGVLNGIDRFEGRSSLKTWIMRIVVNIAISRGEREARSVPFSSFASEGDEPAVDRTGSGTTARASRAIGAHTPAIGPRCQTTRCSAARPWRSSRGRSTTCHRRSA